MRATLAAYRRISPYNSFRLLTVLRIAQASSGSVVDS